MSECGIPEGTRISHKNGWLNDMVGNAGIVYPASGRNYVISVFIWEEADFQDYERLWPLVEGISRAAWNYFSPGAARRRGFNPKRLSVRSIMVRVATTSS